MKLEHLEYLIEVNNCRSISQAAKNLYITQPALSVAIAAMEKELGCSLFKRTKQGVIPTGKGLQVIHDAEKILALTRKWHENAVLEEDIAGNVMFALVPAVGKAFFADILIALRKQYPRLNLCLQEVSRREIHQHVLKSETNIGCSFYLEHSDSKRNLFEHARKHDYKIDILLQDYLVVLVSAKNALAEKECIIKGDLDHIPYADYPNQNDFDVIQAVFTSVYNKQLSFFLNSGAIISKLIAEDMAFSIMPRYTALNSPYVRNGEVVIKEFGDLYLPITYYCFYPEHQALASEETAVIQFIHEYCNQLELTENMPL